MTKLAQTMFVKIEKLTFYHFQPNPDLFYYYAVTDSLTFRGIATPELAEALYDHLEVGEPFKCKIVERDDKSLKLVELLEPAKVKPTQSSNKSESYLHVYEHYNPHGMKNKLLLPAQITVYKKDDKVWANIKSKAGEQFPGRVEKCWFMWYLTMMRKQTKIPIKVMPFSKVFDVFINRKSVKREEFVAREESTYLDNKERFFFANESSTLRQPEYLKKEKPLFSSE